MTESKQIQQILLSEDSHECDTLLDKGELLDKTSIYDLKKIPGVASSDSADSNEHPVQESEGPKGVIESTPVTPAQDEDEDDNASQHSEEGYLPAMLRAAIPGGNKSQTFDVDAKDLCTSPPLERKKKTSRSIRRTKSDKTKSLTLKIVGNDSLTQSLHSMNIKSPTENELERLCKSEELRKTEDQKPETNRRKSETQLQRPPLSSRREKGRSRKPKEAKESSEHATKPSSTRRSKDKPPRSRTKTSKSKDVIPADKQVVEWKRTSKNEKDEASKESEEQQPALKQRKPKKSKSTGSNAAKTKRSKPRETRSLSRSRVQKSGKSLTVETNKDVKAEVVDRKGPTPRQLQRKRTQKQKTSEPQQPKPKPLKSVESPDDKLQKPRSRRALMLTSKATTPSCRNLLRKISKINDDRIKQNESEKDSKKPEPIVEEKSEPIDELSRSTVSTSLELSRSTLSTSHSLTDLEDANHSVLSSIKSKVETSKIPQPEEQEKKEKPPRTRSAPLRKVRKEKSNNSKAPLAINTSTNSLLSAMSLSKKDKTNVSSEKKSMKKSLSDQLQKFGKMLDVKGSSKSKNGDDKTTRTGNRSKDRRNPLKPLTRSRSDSSLGLGVKKQRPRKRASTSQYDLMLSLHSTDEEYDDCDWNSDSDDDNSFSGEEREEAKEEPSVLEVSNKGLETSVKSLSPSDLIKDREEIANKAHKSKTFKFSKSAQKSKTFKFSESAQKSKTFKFSESAQKSKTFKFTENFEDEEMKIDDCDDILSMAEFSEHAREPKKPPSCLQIDFSQLSGDGSSGDIVVRAKKLEKRANRSNQELRTPCSHTVKV